MHTLFTFAYLAIFSMAWRSASAAMQCSTTFNAVSLGPGKIGCQVRGKHYSCKAEDCWVDDPPPRADLKYNVADHIVFKDCHKYKDKFGDSKQEKAEFRVQASRYWMYREKQHANVIGHVIGEEIPKELPGFRCYAQETSLPECLPQSCQLVENANW
ncbi:uncharacterized protein MELLADRAFT_124200 [Melampsora larici-populina 98AG31]|uniref:Secreted protein n=1 Tax=Melampsora larici-populina (strain 98AG31 / pathotype 3-4-7) TaxID=747676 RepID=F4S057_MELLP|nr:uncharacterized protein MELLADRAFT_124200 [Melampsora larici-populina 98AG31]EGG01995.1 secreted protein [Melampsora larici-populina 98AG31]